MNIPQQTREHILRCIEFNMPCDRARISLEMNIAPNLVLSVICRVVSERHGIPCGPPWREQECKPSGPRKPPRQRDNLKPCSCGSVPHAGSCPVSRREYHQRRRAAR